MLGLQKEHPIFELRIESCHVENYVDDEVLIYQNYNANQMHKISFMLL